MLHNGKWKYWFNLAIYFELETDSEEEVEELIIQGGLQVYVSEC